ncbi:hypothetical protein [Psychrobacter piscatorii]|uniref:hypothetical protein n=1 Tax=Psychrobacter piscatorii TaxID=554343 RepID=UPI003736C27A
MNGLGYGSDGDSDSSVTRADITGIAGNKDITTDNRAEYADSTRKISCPCRHNIWSKH